MSAFASFDAVYTDVDKEIEADLLNIIKEHKTIGINEAVSMLEKDHDVYVVKEAVWRLISSGEIRLTPNRKLMIPQG